MRQLDHPNIVKLIEFNETSQYYFIVLELCPGGELFHQIVRLTYFSEDLSRHVIVQVAKALEYLHEEKGVVHRCVKVSICGILISNGAAVTSNPKIFCSTRSRLYPARTRSLDQRKRRTKRTRENSFEVLALGGSAK